MQKQITLGLSFGLFLCIAFVPIACMFGNSLYDNGVFSFEYYRDIFLTDKYVHVILNSLLFAAVTTLLSALAGVPAGFFLAKTNLPLKNFFKVCLLIPLIIPSYIIGIAWTSLLGKAGFLNTVLNQYTLLSSETISNFIYSIYGASCILSMNLFPVIMLVTEYALKNLNPRFEESGLVAGSIFLVLRRITLPLIAPVILSGMVIVFVLSLSEFGIPSLLQINVMTTQILTQFSAFYNEKAATAIAFPLIVITLVFMILEQVYLQGKSFEIMGKKSSNGAIQHRIRWLTTVGILFCILVLTICVIIPFSTLAINSRPLSAYYDAFQLAKNGIKNTLVFSSLGAVFLTITGLFLGYLSEKIQYKLKTVTASFIWIFFAIPATVIGVGLIKLCNRPGVVFQFIYGSLWIIILGYGARFLPLSCRIMANYFKQIPDSLEESGTITGASWFTVLRRILIPLQVYGIIVTWLISFIFCVGELGTTILVYPPGHETLPIALFTIMVNSPEHIVSALSVIMVIMTLIPVGILLVCSKYLAKLTSAIDNKTLR